MTEEILSCLSEEEIAQLNVITEKIIFSRKDAGSHGKQKVGKRRRCRMHCKRHKSKVSGLPRNNRKARSMRGGVSSLRHVSPSAAIELAVT